MKLTGNTVIVTGGSSGIGLELARRLLALGNTVIVTGRDQAKLDAAKAGLKGLNTIQSDVSDPSAIEALFQRVTSEFPKLNVLVNNAGIMRTLNLHDKDGGLLDITREIDINLCGPIRMIKQFLPHLKAQPSAAIMNVSSGLAFVPLPIAPVYCATKAALHSYTESLRVQLKNTAVKVFELAPPATETPLIDAFNADDMQGITMMPVDKMVDAAIKGLQADHFEIRPGQSNQLKLMSRIAPKFILGQLSKPVDRMLASAK